MYSCYECESKRDTTNDVSASCWAVDGTSEKEEAKCHGCYVSRTEESTEEGTDSFFGNMPVTENIKQCLGMFYDIQRRCLTYPQDAEVGFENYSLNFSMIFVDF